MEARFVLVDDKRGNINDKVLEVTIKQYGGAQESLVITDGKYCVGWLVYQNRKLTFVRDTMNGLESMELANYAN